MACHFTMSVLAVLNQRDVFHNDIRQYSVDCDSDCVCADADSKRRRKMAEITQALNAAPVDVATLRRMAISEGGLMNDEIRRKVWPWLLNVPVDGIPEKLGTL